MPDPVRWVPGALMVRFRCYYAARYFASGVAVGDFYLWFATPAAVGVSFDAAVDQWFKSFQASPGYSGWAVAAVWVDGIPPLLWDPAKGPPLDRAW